MFFHTLLILAHLQAVIVPIILGILSINKFNHLTNSFLIPYGFISLGLASLFEMIDHTQTDWIYIDHSSLFNWLFYLFLAIGLTLFSIIGVKNKILIVFMIFLCISSGLGYILFDKSIALLLQVIISIFLIINFSLLFNDWIFILYQLFSIFLTTFFETKSSITGDQMWHVFIGPSGTISIITFYIVFIRSKKILI